MRTSWVEAQTIRLSEADSPSHDVGVLELDVECHELRGPQGAIRLGPKLYAVTEQLMRRPDRMVSHAQLFDAMYPDPDDKPETADSVLRNTLSQLRVLFRLLGDDQLQIMADVGEGYWLYVGKSQSST